MLTKFLDQYKTLIGLPTPMKAWTRIVQTFELKYPEVEVWPQLDKNDIPKYHLVFRKESGVYKIVLYPTLKRLNEEITSYDDLVRKLGDGSGLPRYPRRLNEVKYAAGVGVLGGGTFDYDCRPGIGEFCTRGPVPSGTFLETYVLEDDYAWIANHKSCRKQ